MSRDNLPGWTVIRTREDLEEHDPAEPAYVLVPPGLVPIVGDWLISRGEPGPKGERCRQFEERLLQLAADSTEDVPFASVLGDEAHVETGCDVLPAGDEADDGELAEQLTHQLPLAVDGDVDDEETFLEGEREEPRLDGECGRRQRDLPRGALARLLGRAERR